MKVVETTAELRHSLAEFDSTSSVGLVPTMGFLHEGHLRLVQSARRENQVVVVSIFVNPAQFGPNEDLKHYPRDLDRDLSLLQALEVDIVFAPPAEEVYPIGFSTSVEVTGDLGFAWEAKTRPGHFQGVATVVTKLLNLVSPQRAYFGQKDAQQLAVMRRMVRDLNLPVEICAVATVREPDGLAMSSRNLYLDAAQRQAATILYRSLLHAEELVKQGERSEMLIREAVALVIGSEKMAQLDYVAVVDASTFSTVDSVSGPVLILLAVWVGPTRLIDNWFVEV